MKLYYSKGACSMTVHIILNELKIPFETIEVDIKNKKTIAGDDFLSINSKGAVPVLVLDNTESLTENAVILQYLAETYNATTLLPSVGNFNRYKVLEWLNFLSSDVHKSFSPFFNPKVSEDVKHTIFQPLVEAKFQIVEERLTDHEFLTGPYFTLPDPYLFVMIRWFIALKFDINQYPHVKRYFEDLKNRPSIREAMQKEGIKID